jgi:two-component system chemotaxis response regulator CheY
MMRDLLRRSLERLGFRAIYNASNPVEALPIARANRVHIIISDYNMPQMNGLQFVEAVRADALLARVGFVMLSGSADLDLVRKSKQAGASCYLAKPCSLNDLKRSLEGMFGSIVGRHIELDIAA